MLIFYSVFLFFSSPTPVDKEPKYCGSKIMLVDKYCKSCGVKINIEEVKQNNKKNNKTNIKVLLWIFLFPLMIIYSIIKNDRLSWKNKIIIITLLLIVGGFSNLIDGNQKDEIAYNEIIEDINNKNYLNIGERIDNFIVAYPNSEYKEKLDSIRVKNNQEIENFNIDLDNRKEYEKKINNEITKTLISKKIEESLAIKLFDLINLIELPIWIDEENIVIENYESNDFMISYTANDNGFANIFVFHIFNNEIVEIVDKNMDIIYKDGLNEDYIFFRDIDMIQIINSCKELVESILKSPSTAKFPDNWLSPYEGWSIGKKGNIIQLNSYVDSQNSFGAMLRNKFTINIKKNKEGYEVIYFLFDNNIIIDIK